jgi:hypothetical protein
MVSRNSAFALTVMLLASVSAQASWVPSMPSFSLPSLPSVSSVFNKDNGVFVAKVAAAMVVLDVACKTSKKLWSYMPDCVTGHAAKAHNAFYARTPKFLKTPACKVNDRLSSVESQLAELNATVFAKTAESGAKKSAEAASATSAASLAAHAALNS